MSRYIAVGFSERHGAVLTRFGDALAIVLIVLLNALLGYFQESRAESALRALSSLSVPRARVLRAGALCELPAAKLVPGDVIEVQAGDAVPADTRVLAANAPSRLWPGRNFCRAFQSRCKYFAAEAGSEPRPRLPLRASGARQLASALQLCRA